jgi:hypothetical protein
MELGLRGSVLRRWVKHVGLGESRRRRRVAEIARSRRESGCACQRDILKSSIAILAEGPK